MNKRMKKILIICMALFIVGCASKKPVVKDVRPISHEVSEVESSNSAETLLLATGKGGDVPSATNDAKKAAIWFLLNAGTKPLLKTKAEKRAMNSLEETLYKDVGKYIRNTSELKSKSKTNGGKTTVVKVVVKVDIQMLTDFLVDNEVIQSSEDVADDVGLPAISIVAATSSADADIAKNTLGEYLSDRDYEVSVVEQSGKLSGIANKLSKLSGSSDPAYAWALEAGSEIYVEMKVSLQSGNVSGVDTKKVSVTAKAFETSTARQLGSTTGHSSERSASGYGALTQEATNAVADKLISQIRKKWLKGADKGKWFKVVAFSSESGAKNIDRALYKALKSLPSAKVKRMAAGKTTFQYQVRVKEIENAFDMMEALSGKYKGPGKLTTEMESGTLLVLKAGTGDIEIEFD